MNDSLTVGELCEAIEYAVTTCFPTELWVEGTVAGISRSSAGHVYFDFVDPDFGKAVLPVALFAGAKGRVNRILKESGAARITDGVELKIKGKVAYYPPQGRVQLIMSSIDPSFTLGKLELAKAKLIAELEESGLALTNSRLAIPALPFRVALVTSPGSAAEADFLSELEQSQYPFEVSRIATLVQGTDAPAQIVSAISEAQAQDPDCVVLIRGGGAQSDLAAFDHREVAHSIARCERPVIVGIGHETDTSVADFVAHTAMKTPTAAAAFLVDHVASFEGRLESCAQRIEAASAMSLLHHANRLDRLLERTVEAARQKLVSEHHRLDRSELVARAHNPALIMARGWSITIGADGRALTSVDDLAVSQLVTTRLASGEFSSEIMKVNQQQAESNS